VADHIASVSALHEAFGRGDLSAILGMLADDVQFDADWSDTQAQRAGVEHMTPRRGLDQATDFFALVASWQIDEFQILDLMGSGHQVAAEVRAAFTLPNGGRFVDEEVQLWTFDQAGKVKRLRHYVDTAKHIAASQGTDTTAV
jgi:ketosteroid isomerase-like protein